MANSNLVCMWAIIMFFGMQLDRGNMSLALGDNFLNDLNLSTDGTSFLPFSITD
jgi:hypothetical protein